MIAKNIPPELLEMLKGVGLSLNSLTEDPNVLQDPWRSQLLEIKGQINASLASLAPTDQVPAANEARYGLDTLRNQLLAVQQLIDWLPKVVKGYSEKYATVMNSIPAEADKKVKEILAGGTYVTKQDAEALVTQAKKDAELAGFTRGKLLGDRRQAIVLAGIPAEVAAGAPEELLLGDEKEFTPAIASVKDRVKKLTDVGIVLNHATMKVLPWAKPEDFDVQYQLFADIAKANGKGRVLNRETEGAPPNGFLTGAGGVSNANDLVGLPPM